MSKITKFINSIYFIIFVNAIAVLFWYLEKPIYAYIIYLVLCIIIVLSNANRTAIASIIMSSIIGYQLKESDYLEFHTIYSKIFIPLGLVVIVIFAYDLIKRKTPLRTSPIFYGLVGILIANILAFINVREKELFFISSLGVLQLLGYLIIYTYILNTQNEDGKTYISNIALITATAITVQFIIHYISLGSVTSKGDNDLSWAVSNSIAMFYLVLIPVGLYNYFKEQKNFIILIITVLNFFMVLFMLSRGAYLSLMIILIPSFILCVGIAKDKRKLFVDVIAALIICLVISLTIGKELGLVDLLKDYIKNMDFLYNNGREKLFIKGWELFKKYPIFGAGSYSGAYYLKEYNLGTYHNIFVQTIATTGIVGLISLIYFIYTVLKASVKKNFYNLLYIVSFVYILVHGMVDTSIYNPIIMVFLATTLPFLEHYHEDLEGLELK